MEGFMYRNKNKNHNNFQIVIRVGSIIINKYMQKRNPERVWNAVRYPKAILESGNQTELKTLVHETFGINLKLKENIHKNLMCNKVKVYFIWSQKIFLS